MTPVTSRTTDKIARGFAALFAFGVAISAIISIGSISAGRWVNAVVYGLLLLVFAAQLYGWARASSARLVVDDNGARREGPQGWSVDRETLARGTVRTVRGTDYLVVPGGRRHLSSTFLGLPQGSYACPLEPGVAERLPVAR